ncbi:MAG TPA: glycoside hydrolase family 18 protein [Treponemataceae bacterium]|nr:glycoside hydrolase family 18 protein [Treponemataceae bacterium]
MKKEKGRSIVVRVAIALMCTFMVTTLVTVSCASQKTTVKAINAVTVVQPLIDPNGPIVASYIRTWPIGSTVADMDSGLHWTADDIKGEYLTDLIIAFALINPEDGSSIYIKDMEDQPSSTDPSVMVSGFHSLWNEIAILQARYPHLNINLSIGGYGAEGFSDMAFDPALRASFIANVISWVNEKGLDGVDIDWEYPVGPEWGLPIKTRPEDRKNYLSLLSELRTALNALGNTTGKTYKLSTAVPASGWFIGANDVVAASKIVDALKIMSYDYYGSWSGTTGHTANLYNNPSDPEWGGWSSDQALKAYLEAGVSPAKIVIGAAFYGRAWTGVSAGNTNGLFQKYTESAYPDGISIGDVKKLLASNEGYIRYWDNIAKAPFLYNGTTFITYTDEEAIKEITSYAKAQGLAGVMNWEYAHDINAELLKHLASGIQK